MRIISKTKDYYDSVQKQGMDSEVLYVRDSKTLDFNFPVYKEASSFYVVETFIIGYCGQVYKCAKYKNNLVTKYYFDIGTNLEPFKKDMIEFGVFKADAFNSKRWSFRYGIGKFLDASTTDLFNLFHTHQAPLFLIRYKSNNDESSLKTKLVLNPKLEDYNFQSFKDPYTAYQDIFQYVAGVLNQAENKMIKISDKDKISKHGFDKWSFRTQPKDLKHEK